PHWVLLVMQKLEQNHPGRFFDVAYPLPTDLTRGKRRVTVRFQARPHRWTGGLYGARMLKYRPR
ncbi:MAG: hypothetical protein ACYDC1_16510, partial [Limisphaerales bacterium]